MRGLLLPIAYGASCTGFVLRSRKNNAFRELAANAENDRRCTRGATTLSPPRTVSLGAHQGLESRIIFQVAPPPADVLAPLEMPRVGG